MLSVKQLPIELQYIIMKYISYSPTANMIQQNLILIDRKRELYDYANLYSIFHTNVYYPIKRLFNHDILKYIRSIQLSLNPINPSIHTYLGKEYFQERLIKLNTIYVKYKVKVG
jgi:hypothetical protein